MSDWYYRIGERVYGPYSEDDLRGRIKSVKIPSNTSVSRDGFTDWQEASVSLLEKESRPPKTSRGAIFRQKFASIFKRQKGARSFQASPWTRSRKRILFWCLGIVFAGAIACVVVKTAGRHRVGGWVRRILTVFQASAAPSHYTLEKTRTYWLELRQIDKTARESLGKMPEGKNPFNEVGQADMADFDRKDFEDFRVYQFKRAKIVRDCIEKLEKLPVYEVDPALLSYELELSELWLLVERACMDIAEIASDKEEQQSCFSSPEAYALRFGTNSRGPSEMEYRNHKSQEQIAEKIRKLSALTDEGTEAQANLTNREEEVKALLTSRYGWKFQ